MSCRFVLLHCISLWECSSASSLCWKMHVVPLILAESAMTTSCSSDSQRYRDFTTAVQRERELLDKKKKLEDEIHWLEQTLSLLILSTTSTSTNGGASQVVAAAIKERKEKITASVRNE